MAASPQFKIYDSQGIYQAACKEPEAASVLVTFYGEGSTIRNRHYLTVWTEGVDGCAADSYDKTMETIMNRIQDHYDKRRNRFSETRWYPNA